jgi:hypothetical protein
MKNITIKEIKTINQKTVTEDTLFVNHTNDLHLTITHKDGFAVSGEISLESGRKPIALSNIQAVQFMDEMIALHDRIRVYGQPIVGILA